jgi:hypothetical protein
VDSGEVLMKGVEPMKGARSRQFVRVTGWLGVIGVVGFCLGVVAAGLAFTGYSHVDQMISELGGSEATRPWIQNVNFVLFGTCVFALAVGLMVDAGKVFVGAVLLAVFGLAGILVEGLARCDAGCKGATTEAAVHRNLGFVGLVAGVVALFLLSRRWRHDPRWADHARFTRWCAWAALVGLVVNINSEGTPFDGLAKRVFIATLLVFLAGTGWRMAMHPSVSDDDGSTVPVAQALGRPPTPP